MNFIDSNRANVHFPINLNQVIAFNKDHAGSTTMIVFHTIDGKSFRWKYYSNKANRDEDYTQVCRIISDSLKSR